MKTRRRQVSANIRYLDMAPKIRVGNNHVSLPRSRIVRVVIGVALIVGGVLGFLPFLGFWMIPLGLLVLSIDLPAVRRWRRRLDLWWERRRRGDTAQTQRRNKAETAPRE